MTIEELAQAIEDRTGQPVDEAWLETVVNELMAYIRMLAPCKRDEWETIEDLPSDITAILVAAIARIMLNPRNLRQETIGEYSYTVGTGGNGDMFTDLERRVISSIAGCGGSFKSVRMGVTPPPVKMTEPDRDYFSTLDYDANDAEIVFGGPYESTGDSEPTVTVKTSDVELTHPTRAGLTTQEDANQYMAAEIDARVTGDGVKNMVYLTKDEFDALSEKDANTIYVVED